MRSRGRSTKKRRFGRSKPVTNANGFSRRKRRCISPRTRFVAVAVKAHRRGRAGRASHEFRYVEIAGAKILPPLGDAMRLVDGDHGDGQRAANAQKTRRKQALGGDVDQLVLPAGEVSEGNVHLSLGERAVEKRRRHARLLECRHLILHQRNERRDHQRASRQRQRRHLIANGLARTGRHHGQDVAACKDGVDRLFLPSRKVS